MNNTCLNCTAPARVKFCSRSCAATYNNSMLPRRKPEHKCIVCEGPTTAQKRICSKKCREDKYNLHTTIGDLKAKANRDAQVYNTLRQRSRRLALAMPFILECEDCGWDEHVEICHIKDLAKLPDTTTVFEATQPTNFLFLCPNHHWKFDHNNDYRKAIIKKWFTLRYKD